MRCEQCGSELPEVGQRFCNHCGASVAHLTRPDTASTETASTDTASTETASTGTPAPDAADVEVDDAEPVDDGASEATGDGSVLDDSASDASDDGSLDDSTSDASDDGPLVIAVVDAETPERPSSPTPITTPIPTVTPTPTTTTTTTTMPTAVAEDEAFTPKLPAPMLYDAASDLADGEVDATLPFHLARPRIGVVVVLGGLTGILGLLGLFPRVLTIRTTSSSPAFGTGDWLVADFGGNLPAALIVALVALLVGLIGAAYRQRWGFGLVGGAGLAIAGWSALMIGLAERPIRVAIDAAERPSFEAFTVTITRDLGYGLIAAAGIGGVVVFIASLGRAGPDRRRSLNPWIAALGALAALVAAAGPLLPEGTASIADNWTQSAGAPSAFLIGRLVQVGALAVSGVVGFLVVRRYGLGLVVGGMTVNVWLVVSVLTGLGDDPIGPALDNPGSITSESDLHAVTLAGSAALLVLAIIAVIAAYDLAAREP